MSFYTDWFIADVTEAEAIACIGSADEDDEDEEGHDFEDWPHLAMKSIGQTELMLLRGVALGRPGELADTDGETLHLKTDEDDEGGVSVAQVLPEFVSELAALTPDDIQSAAGQWSGTENMSDWSADDAASLLTEIVAFARQAQREGKPVLEMATW